MSNSEMVRELRRTGYITSKKVEEAMLAVDRALFMPEGTPAYEDRPYPTAKGQTISAPSVVAFMLEHLRIEKGMKILEVGAGSGYSAALLSHLAGGTGKVISLEIFPEVFEIASKNLSKLGPPKNIELICGDASEGYPESAPYDRIMVTAAMPYLDMSHPLIQQLADDGMIIAPVGGRFFQDLVLYDNKTKESQKVLPVIFVPLRGKKGFNV